MIKRSDFALLSYLAWIRYCHLKVLGIISIVFLGSYSFTLTRLSAGVWKMFLLLVSSDLSNVNFFFIYRKMEQH